MSVKILAAMSNRYGADEDYVLAGGGNTSYKEAGILYVKGSGTSLADIKPEQFVRMDRRLLCEMVEKEYPADMSDDEREEDALASMMAARLPGEESKRPSVEATVHALFPYKLVLHVHPPLVNGLTCGKRGKELCDSLFGEKAAWIGLTKPGLVLAQTCQRAFDSYTERVGKYPQIVLLQNHGIFVAADTVEEIDFLMGHVNAQLNAQLTRCVAREPDFSEVPFDRDLACSIAPALRMLTSSTGEAIAIFCTNKQVMEFVSDADKFAALTQVLTPDHIVYYKDEPLLLEPGGGAGTDYGGEFADYVRRKGYMPKIAAVRGLGFFALGKSRKEADIARLLFLDAIKVMVYADAFGGVSPMDGESTDFILNWEAEKYRANTSLSGGNKGCLDGKIALVTGSAQGFGKGIAESMAAEGAYLGVADLNDEGAAACASELNSAYGQHVAVAVAADVSDEESVKRMVQDMVLAFGGLDVLVSNAGVLIAGGLAEMTKQHFDLVTAVNYTGYFLCTKHASEVMKIQNRYAPGYLTDIIEINSKSGLEGSNKNFAYAGSKFGGIGLTQSFAMELIEYGIKVNAICPGNLLDGPLWADPERGLFRQYLDSGKVPGAKSIEDVRKFYEAKVPMKRGCTITDVAQAIFYLIAQEYETGQALPVTGGQVMLH
jgi:NAD(P)-dependent dehydrogenase (short-subunit alcohol dehydrogenase family)/rhamnose utilization protein RhaD (predicted bifunctional aldolase and dehydrogenase)